MSLQLAAQHLSNQGRGNDSTLVHMSPREVKSLNALAMAHGGQLSINPQTGLPEAGFLSSILPMVAGAALTGLSGGAINPMTAGLITGGLGYAMTGSLSKGLMMGLGAYGGGNLGEALATQGMQAAAMPAAADLTSAGAMAQQSALAQQEIIKEAALAAPVEGATTQMMLDNQALAGAGANQAAQLQAVQNAALTPEAAKMQLANMTMGERFNAMKGGIGSLGQEGGLSSLYQNLGGSPMSLISKLGPAAAPAIGEAMTPKKQEEEKADADMGQRYAFSMNPTGGQKPQQVQPGQDPLSNTQSPTTTPFPFDSSKNPFDSSEKRYFSPSYRKITAEEAKELYGYAEGGEVDKAEPKETPALEMFKQMQAQRAAQPPVAQIDAKAQYADYLKQTRAAPTYQPSEAVAIAEGSGVDSYGQPYSADNPRSPISDNNPLLQPQTPPAAVSFDTEMLYNPATQKYTKNPNFVDASAASDDPLSPGALAGNFAANNPGVPYLNVDPKTGQWTNYDRYGVKLNANGGLMDAYAGGGMPTDPSSIGANEHYPHAHTPMNRFSTPTQIPIGEDIVSSGGARIDLSTGEERLAAGGISHLGDYSDGGRLLRGPGDGVSDSIPAMIGKRQPARLADGEFVVPARIVSELGNGSTEAGARKLYAMMDRIQKARRKTVGKGKVAKNSRSEKYLPA